MTRYRSSFENRHELYLGAAVLSAHSTVGDPQGFRQRDVRFFVTLFLNWFAEAGVSAEVQNTQVLRYLNSLITQGLLRINSRSTRPAYRLSRTGMMELLNALTSPRQRHAPSHFLFLVYFLVSYGKLLVELVEKEGPQFPPLLRIELLALLDVQVLIEQEVKATERDISKIESRISTATKVAELVSARVAAGSSLAQITTEVERRYPYDLNSTIPLSRLLSTLQPKQRLWEIKTGDTLRRDVLWKPELARQKAYLAELKRLRGNYSELARRGVE